MTFPINPSPGDSYTAYGTVWVYAGTVNGWYRQIVSTQNDTTYTSAISGPAGSNTQVQFNDNGELAGDSGLTYNKTTDALSGGAFIPTGSTVPTNGLYRPSANNVALSTNGTERLRITSAGNVGISTAAPQSLASIGVGSSTENGLSLTFVGDNSIKAKFYASTSSGAVTIGGSASGYFPVFISNNSEAARIDTSGRLLVGTSTSRGLVIGGNSTNWAGRVQSSTTSVGTGIGFAAISWSDYATDLGGGSGTSDIVLARSNSNAEGTQAAVTNGMLLGRINFNGSDGTAFANGAYISAASDGQTWAPGDCPSRLVFSTTADGASSPTERLRITSAGLVGIGTSSPDANSQLHIVGSSYQPLYVNTTGVGGGGATFFRSGTQALYVGTAGSSWLSGSSIADGLVRAEANLVLSTNGNSRAVTIDTSQRVGIGTTSPAHALTVGSGSISISNRGSGNSYLFPDWRIYNSSSGNALVFDNYTTEAFRVDSSNRLLVGTSSARTNIFNTVAAKLFQVESDGGTAGASLIRNSADGGSPDLVFGKSRSASIGGNTIVQSGDAIGSISFQGNDGSEFVAAASITAEVDGTPGANDMPGRLVFSTTADGASSPTERMRIKNNGTINFSNVAVYADNAAATTGGLAVGDVYRTSTGQLMIRY